MDQACDTFLDEESFFKKSLAESMNDLEIQTPPKFKSSNSLDGDTLLNGKTCFEKKDEHSECPNLQKAQSVPHLTNVTGSSLIRHGSITQRKKTSEASSISETLLHAKLLQENQSLKEKVLKIEEEKNELVKINNIWNTDYTSLKQQLSSYEKELSCLKEELNNREKHIKKLTKKLEVMFVVNSETNLWDQLKSGDDEENDVCKDTPNNKQEDPMYQSNTMMGSGMGGGFASTNQQYLELSQENQDLRHQNNMLHKRLYELQEQCKFFDKQIKQKDYDIQRISTEKLNPLQKSDKQLSTTSLSPSSIDAIGDQAEVEILRHQLKVYVEDFRIETEERKKLLNDNLQLKKALSKLNEDQEHLKTQLKVYEDDFCNERNKRVELMNMMQNQNDLKQQQTKREWQEYCQLMQEKDRINDRIKDMENHGVPFNAGGRSSSMSSTSRPQRNHQPIQQQLSGPPSMVNPPASFVNGPKAFFPSSSGSEFQPISSSSNYQQPPSNDPNDYHQPASVRHQQTSPMSTYSLMPKTSESDRYRHFSSAGGSDGNQAMFRNNRNEENVKTWLSPNPRDNKYNRIPSESSFR